MKRKLIDFYHIFRYDIPNLLSNLWFFRKELYHFRTWDSTYNVSLFRRSLEATVKNIELYGNEIEVDRMKKVKAMKRTIELMENFENHSYMDLVEKETGTHWEDNPEIFKLTNEREYNEWLELWEIIKGTEYNNSEDLRNPNIIQLSGDSWDDKYDGSNLKRWWD